MTIHLVSGTMCSNKSKALIEKAERLSIMGKKYFVFYPSCCSNGYDSKVVSRSGGEIPAIPIDEPLDIWKYVNNNNVKDILIDELQFICKDEQHCEDLKNFCIYCEKNDINIFCVGLDLDFSNSTFRAYEVVSAYANIVEKKYAVCEICKKENARKPLRLKGDGTPSSLDEPVLVEKDNEEYKYMPVCPKCYYKFYNNI